MKKFLTACILILMSVSLVLPQVGFAFTGSGSGVDEKTGSSAGKEGQDSSLGATLTNPLDSSISSIPAFFEAIIDIIIVFAIPFVVFFIVYSGYLYVTAQGNAEKVQKAHAALLYALIGGLLILGSRTLLTIITNTVEQIK